MSETTTRRILHALQALLLLCLFVGSFMQYDVGLADNGDFTRLMTWFSSGPVGFAENWPPQVTPEYDQRFFQFNLPYWKLDFPMMSRWVSSILLVWLPGVLINMVGYSSTVLYLPNLSIAPRVLSFLFLIVLLRFIERRSPLPITHSLVLGIPFVLTWTNTDIVAYFNSFYQEPSSFIALFLLLSLFARYRMAPLKRSAILLWTAAVLFMVSAKISNIYWSVLVTVFVLPLSQCKKQPAMSIAAACGMLILPLAFSLLQANLVGSRFDNAYQSIFCGALAFSSNADRHLQRLGLEDYRTNIDVPAYTESGRACIAEHRDLMRHTTTLNIIAHEPLIAWRMFTFAADSMQRLELAHLGKTILVNDESFHTKQPRVFRSSLLHLLRTWTTVKDAAFPRGDGFIGTLLLFLVINLYGLRHPTQFVTTLAWIGLLCIAACATDMWIEIFGDGKRDLLKHLVLPNLLFDIALSISIVIITAFASARFRRREEIAIPIAEPS